MNKFDNAKYQLETIESFNDRQNIKFDKSTFNIIKKQLELGKLYSQLVNNNLQINLNVLDKIKELENEKINL